MSMSAEIRKLMHAEPFVPFAIHTADGGVLPVPTVDHVAVSRAGGRIFIFTDDDDYQIISPLLVARLTVESGASASVPND